MVGELAVPGQPVLSEPPRRRRRVVIGAILMAVVVLAAGLGGYFYFAHRQGPAAAPVIADGPTFFQALAQVDDSVLNTSGGPWGLFSVYGIAAPVPFSPNLIGYAHTNITVNSCGAAFNGLTLWNGTIPLFNGTFDSGTAPFWQLAYFSNSSQEIIVGTDVLGHLHVFPAIPYPSACMPWYDLPGNTANWTSPALLPKLDTPVAARLAWNAILGGQLTVGDWVDRNAPMAEIMTFGPNVFQGFGDISGGYGVYFDRCGELGAAGVQSMVVVGVNTAPPPNAGTFNITHNCNLLESGPPGYSAAYDLLFSPPSTTHASSTTYAASSFQVAIAYPNGTLGNFFDEIGLANWMTSWNLTSASGQRLPLAMPTCRGWVPSIADCGANASGWYAVVLSGSGEWINSYGALPGGGVGWFAPVTSFVSHQQFVIVTPSTWSLSGDNLSVASTNSTVEIFGSLSL